MAQTPNRTITRTITAGETADDASRVAIVTTLGWGALKRNDLAVAAHQIGTHQILKTPVWRVTITGPRDILKGVRSN